MLDVRLTIPLFVPVVIARALGLVLVHASHLQLSLGVRASSLVLVASSRTLVLGIGIDVLGSVLVVGVGIRSVLSFARGERVGSRSALLRGVVGFLGRLVLPLRFVTNRTNQRM